MALRLNDPPIPPFGIWFDPVSPGWPVSKDVWPSQSKKPPHLKTNGNEWKSYCFFNSLLCQKKKWMIIVETNVYYMSKESSLMCYFVRLVLGFLLNFILYCYRWAEKTDHHHNFNQSFYQIFNTTNVICIY